VKPFLRPTDRGRLAPVGWVSEPAGRWAGRQVEVVYDPARHQVVLARNDLGDTNRRALAGAGYRRVAVDGPQEMWVRGRADTVRAALGRVQARNGRAAELGGRAL
jgi:hypothetical protein